MSSGWKKGLYLLGLTGIFCAGWMLHQKMKGIKMDVAAEAVQPKEQEEGAVLETRKIALTFDDGPHSVYTEEMLNVLEEAEVPATFFLLGQNIEGREELVQKIAEKGHLIGNHTMDHVQLNHQTYEKALEQIRASNQVISQITGQTPVYIRPPFGEWSKELQEEVDMTAVLWDVDPVDWKVKNTETVVKRILKNARDGDIILLHDVYGTSVDAALEIVDQMRAEGYEFVTVDEIILD